MGRKLSNERIESVLACKGLPYDEIERRTGVSRGKISELLGAKAKPQPARRRSGLGNDQDLKPRRAKAPRHPPAPKVSMHQKDDASPLERLTRAVKSLEHAAKVAAADGDQARVVAALRAVSDVTKTIAALTPAPPVDHNEHPDMVAAAKECRELVFGFFERVVAEAEK
jgi:hypothetical protein